MRNYSFTPWVDILFSQWGIVFERKAPLLFDLHQFFALIFMLRQKHQDESMTKIDLVLCSHLMRP